MGSNSAEKRQCQLLIYEIGTNLFFLVKKVSSAGQTTETNNPNSTRPSCHKNPVDWSDLKKPGNLVISTKLKM